MFNSIMTEFLSMLGLALFELVFAIILIIVIFLPDKSAREIEEIRRMK